MLLIRLGIAAETNGAIRKSNHVGLDGEEKEREWLQSEKMSPVNCWIYKGAVGSPDLSVLVNICILKKVYKKFQGSPDLTDNWVLPSAVKRMCPYRV